MADRMTNREIEDVLSSIRRLVSEDIRTADPRVATRLVLTQSQRVAASAPAFEPDDASLGAAHGAAAQEALEDAMEERVVQAENLSDGMRSSARGNVARRSEPAKPIRLQQAVSGDLPRSTALALEARIAELEAMVAAGPQDFEPDEGDPFGTVPFVSATNGMHAPAATLSAALSQSSAGIDDARKDPVSVPVNDPVADAADGITSDAFQDRFAGPVPDSAQPAMGESKPAMRDPLVLRSPAADVLASQVVAAGSIASAPAQTPVHEGGQGRVFGGLDLAALTAAPSGAGFDETVAENDSRSGYETFVPYDRSTPAPAGPPHETGIQPQPTAGLEPSVSHEVVMSQATWMPEPAEYAASAPAAIDELRQDDQQDSHEPGAGRPLAAGDVTVISAPFDYSGDVNDYEGAAITGPAWPEEAGPTSVHGSDEGDARSGHPRDGASEGSASGDDATSHGALVWEDDRPADPQGSVEEGAEELIDEVILRELVRDILREELQGALGDRITRNVRKLVRAEIGRVMASRNLD